MRKKAVKTVVWLVTLILMFTMTASVVFAKEGGEPENHAPVLKDGVEAQATGQVVKKEAYLLGSLMNGLIFTDPDGDKLNYKKNYFYQRSTDNGETWGPTQDFDDDSFATTISLTENTAGVYVYRFWAVDPKGASSADNNVYWVLTLNVVDEAIWDTSFYVGQDMNYKTNGNTYPTLAVYKTAGVNMDKNSPQYNFDYVGTFVKDGVTVFVYDPADYIITGDAESGWKIRETEAGQEYDLLNYEPISFTDSTFGKEPGSGNTSGTVVGSYNMFYASVKNGWYSYRGYGYNSETSRYDVKLGGMKIKLPTDANVDGAAGGGKDIYLRVCPTYTSSKKADNSFFTADEYHAAVVCPIMECNPQPGTPYQSGNYAYYPFFLYAGGNSCLYNFYGYPDIEGYIFSQSINATIATGYTVNNRTVTINTAVQLRATVPENTEFGLFFQYNNFNSGRIEPAGEAVNNGDGTKTITFNVSKGNGNYTWRLEDPSGQYVTKAGYLSSTSSDLDVAFSFDESSPTEKKSHDFSNLGTQTSKRDEADIQVGLDPTGYLAMDEDAEKRVRVYRHWEIISSDTGNIMIEPDFNWSVLSGSASIKTVDGGNASDNWADIDPEGTAIVAVNYDSIDVFMDNAAKNHGSHGGLYPATSTNRTGVFVVSDTEKGTAAAHIKYNTDGTPQTRPEEWDYNYDTWYYLTSDEKPVLDFTVTGEEVSKVQYSLVTSGKTLKSKMTAWRDLTPDEDGKYIVDLNGFRNANANGGTVIIRMTDSTGTSYCLARVAEVEAFAENATKPGEAIEPGDQVTLTFDGLYRALNKQSGIFNPTTFVTRYSAGTNEVSGTVGQYQQLDTTKITLTVPEDIEFPEGKDETTYNFTNGYVFGQMFSAANPFRFVYEMTDTGVGTNFNAVTVKLCFQRLADVTVNVKKHTSVDLKVAVTDGENPLDDVSLIVKDPAGNELTAEDGKYTNLSYGTYTYTAKKKGYVSASGKFTVASTDELDGDGCVTKTIAMHALGAGEWDGELMVEPAKNAEGFYEIESAEELAWFANAVNTGNAAINAILKKDIDLCGRSWTPIGLSTSGKQYQGTFDGANHTVKGLFIDVTGEKQADVQYKGLFGYVKGKSTSARATIKNLKVSGSVHAACEASVSNAYIGGVCGYTYYANLENVISDVAVSVEPTLGNWSAVGGVCGYAYYVNLKQCLNKGNVSGQMHVGGVAGNFGNDVIDQCANYGTITAGGTYAGGVAGFVSSTKNAPSKLTNCYNMGKVTGNGDYAGGITASFGVYSEVSNSFNAGDVVSATGEYAGAFAGWIGNNSVASDVYALNDLGLNLFGSIGTTSVTIDGELINTATLASAKFLKTLNGDGNAFVAGENGPVLAWIGDEAPVLPCAHKLTKHKAVAETCTENGNIEYWTCSRCGEAFSDAEGTTKINEADTVIKAHGLKLIPAVQPGCTKAGHNAYYKCKDKTCGKCYKDAEGTIATTEEAEVIPATGHKLKKADDIKASFEADGYVSWTCENCGELFADEQGTIEISSPVRIARLDAVSLSYATTVFNGKAQKPEVTVKDVDGKVVDAANYDVAYGNESGDDCINAGSHKVTVTFKNNYEGTYSTDYEITVIATTAELAYTTTVYNGKDQKPEVTVKDADGNVVGAANYDVVYDKNCKDAGEHKVKVTAKGNYSGETNLSYMITASEITAELAYTTTVYNGKDQKPGVTVKDADGNVVDAANYDVVYDDNCKDVGEHKVKVTAKGNYSGEAELVYTITPMQTTAKLAYTKIAYNGKVRKPAVTVTDKDGKPVDKNDYTVTYNGGCIKVGSYSVTVAFRDGCSKDVQLAYKIIPKKTTLKKLTPGKTTMTASWKKIKKEISGYQIVYSTDKNFKGAKKVTAKAKATSVTIKKLKANTKYYVKVRTFKKVGGKTYYSEWSNVLTKKTTKK